MNTNRLYNDLAWLWPLWESPEDYREETDFYFRLLSEHTQGDIHTVLDMGCGGGKSAYNLKEHADLTGIDLSEEMLAHARILNPECTFVQADMRHAELGRQFDAVYINDAVSYMTTPEDLAAALRTAWKHLRPGGAMLVVPDFIKETFVQDRTHITTGIVAHPHVTFVEHVTDVDACDGTCDVVFTYFIRTDSELRVETDRHSWGLFPGDTWRSIMRLEGFELHETRLPAAFADGDGVSRDTPVFIGVKPVSAQD